jgi:transmembrane sensor
MPADYMPDTRASGPAEQIRQEAIDWLLLLRQEELASEDLNAFAEWLARDGSHVAAFFEAEQLFMDMTAAARDLQAPAGVAPQRRTRTKHGSRWLSLRSGPWLKTSLAVAAAWLLGFHLILPERWSPLDFYGSDYRTGVGEVRRIPLPDGSLVILDTDTAIGVDLDGPLRRITLQRGRLHVEVKSDPQRPFEVLGQHLAVRALGTAFDVRQDPADTEVTVQEHAVSARLLGHSGDGQAVVTVHAGQQIRYRGGNRLPPPEAVSMEQASAWQQKRLLVSDRPLEQLIPEIERYQFGRIFLSGGELKSLRVSGLFDLDHPEHAIKSLCLALGLRETRIGPWVLLHR